MSISSNTYSEAFFGSNASKILSRSNDRLRNISRARAQKGRPVAMLRSLDDDSHVQTRLCQYEAISSEKGKFIAKQLIIRKFYGCNNILEKHHLRPLSDKYVQLIMNI